MTQRAESAGDVTRLAVAFDGTSIVRAIIIGHLTVAAAEPQRLRKRADGAGMARKRMELFPIGMRAKLNAEALALISRKHIRTNTWDRDADLSIMAG
jgi:hypothetical protein